MKIQLAYRWINKLLAGKKRADLLSFIQQQRFLLHHGLESTAEVMDSFLSEEKIGSQFPVRLCLKLKMRDGSFLYTHTNTLVPLNKVPNKGQTIRIRYVPENMTSVLVL